MKNHGIPKNAKDMMKHFGKDAFKLNAHEKKFIREQGFDTECLFIETKEQRAAQRGWCSHCRKWLTLPLYDPARLAHNEKVRCPKCKTELTVKHAWRMGGRLFDESLCYLYRQSVQNPEVVTARAVSVVRCWGAFLPTPTKMEPEIRVDSFYVFEPGKGGKMLKPINNMRVYWAEETARRFSCAVYEMAHKPNKRDAVYVYKNGGPGYREWVTVAADTEGAFEAAKDSPLRYGMEEYEPYESDHFLRYWHWAARYSSVEKLVKIGLASMIGEKMNGSGNEYYRSSAGNVINWRGKDLSSILRGRLTKEDKAFLLTNGDEVDRDVLSMWQFFEQKQSIAEAVKIAHSGSDWICYRQSWRCIKRHTGDIEKAARYIGKKKGRSPDLYADYLDECVKLGYDLTDKTTRFPRDLQAAHAHTMEQIKYQESQALEAEYAKKRRPAMRRKYQWAAMGLAVVVPERVSDLIAEGEKQHNCVGGYMERVAKGQTDVVFIRREDEPETSYITMEIHKGQIVQARTKNNGPLDKLGEKFVEAFRAEKLEKKKKERIAV